MQTDSTEKRVVILGSTGSIGTQTLDIIRQHPTRLRVVGLAAHQNARLLGAQSAEFENCPTVLFDEVTARENHVPGGINAVVDLVTQDNVDIVVVSVAGVIGLIPTLAAIRAGKHIALASKEVLVAAGEVVMPLLREHGVTMTPIDSEHSAIFQCLQGGGAVDSIILTASGGPFRGRTRSELSGITKAQALDHPTWRMGGKITIDSATLMNKALEMIEAKWLFGLEMKQVEVVIHPQSIVHSMVRFGDGSVIGQLGWPDMRLPIQYALLFPDRAVNELPKWDPIKTSPLTFEAVDETTFAALSLASRATEKGGTAPAVLNAANESAVAHFLNEKIGFLEIVDRVSDVLESHTPSSPTFAAIQDADLWARAQIADRIGCI